MLVPYQWDVRRIDVFWLSKKQRVGWINELKVGYIDMSKSQVAKQFSDDYLLMREGRARMINGPYAGKFLPEVDPFPSPGQEDGGSDSQGAGKR